MKLVKQPLWYIKLTRFEFWPYWVFYLPFLFYGLFLALRARSFTYFTAVNPGMKAGGLVGESKLNMLSQLDATYVPQTIRIDTSTASIKTLAGAIQFPCIAKPSTSERGIGVEKIHSQEELLRYLTSHSGEVLLQEFIDFDIELGILYHRFPNGKSGITSVVHKEFLSVTGNGTATLLELLKGNERARFRMDYLKIKFKDHLKNVPLLGEKILLEPIGNHNRGTAFLDANYLINPELVAVLDTLAAPLKGFYYGRFDIKTKSIADLYANQNIRVLEVNGVESEPAHIYDPSFKLLAAYKAVKQHMDIIYTISNINRKNILQQHSLFQLISAIFKHFAERKQYSNT